MFFGCDGTEASGQSEVNTEEGFTNKNAPQLRGVPEVAATGLEHLSKTPQKQGERDQGGTKSGTSGGDSGFADAVMAVMRLPLSDAEKAEAVRRLLTR